MSRIHKLGAGSFGRVILVEFNAYKKLQEEGSSWSFNNDWGDQMEKAILAYLSEVPKESHILDLGCGEGRGLLALKNLGFTNLVGFDISGPKIEKAKSYGLEAYEGDFHDMTNFRDGQFDYLFCSHAIEHSLDPTQVLREARRISKNGLFIAPIDSKEQPPLGQSPHTHNFYNQDQWITLFNSVFTNFSHVPINRIGQEVWSYYEG
jgi:ubiquinone/menaquinone biosynthesis C-methylase UbiE